MSALHNYCFAHQLPNDRMLIPIYALFWSIEPNGKTLFHTCLPLKLVFPSSRAVWCANKAVCRYIAPVISSHVTHEYTYSCWDGSVVVGVSRLGEFAKSESIVLCSAAVVALTVTAGVELELMRGPSSRASLPADSDRREAMWLSSGDWPVVSPPEKEIRLH